MLLRMQLLHDESIGDLSIHRRAEALYEIAEIFNVSLTAHTPVSSPTLYAMDSLKPHLWCCYDEAQTEVWHLESADSFSCAAEELPKTSCSCMRSARSASMRKPLQRHARPAQVLMALLVGTELTQKAFGRTPMPTSTRYEII